MKEIPLTQGQIALVDDEDYEWINQWKWCASFKPRYNFGAGAYMAVRNKKINGKVRYYSMHRVIMGAESGDEVDHINGNTLDNRRENLRLVSRSQNNMNKRKQSNNKSGYKGVYQNKTSGRWVAQIIVRKKKYNLGAYATPEEAHEAYKAAALELHGEFARVD